jgi:hypothetical protein
MLVEGPGRESAGFYGEAATEVTDRRFAVLTVLAQQLAAPFG